MDPEEIRKNRLELFKDDPKSDKQLPLMADEIRARGKVTKKQIYATGQVLTEAKDLMEHGKFKEWVRGNCEFSYPTANNFMNVYKTYLGRPGIVQTIPLSILYQIASPGFPKDLREYIYTNADGLKKIKIKQIRDISKRVKKGELPLDSPEVKAVFKFRQKNAQARAYENELTERFAYLEKLRKYIEKQTSDFIWPTFPGKNRTEMTEEQVTQLTDAINDIEANVGKLKPSDLKEVKRIRPRFVVPEK